jgi:hypothetical protein
VKILTAALISVLVGSLLWGLAPASACSRIGSIQIGSDCDEGDDGSEPNGPDGRTSHSAERRLFDLLNAERTRSGLPRLAPDPAAAAIARAHSATMARKGKIYHSPALRQGSPADLGSSALGENVGYGPSASQIHTAFMRSPPHRANIMRSFSAVGVGVRVQGATVWVTQLFVLRSTSARSTPARQGGSLRSISPLQALGEPVGPASRTVLALTRAGAPGAGHANGIPGTIGTIALFSVIAAWASLRYRGNRSKA